MMPSKIYGNLYDFHSSLQRCKHISERGVVLNLMPMAVRSWTGLEQLEVT